MTQSRLAASFVAAVVVGMSGRVPASTQTLPDLTGRWTLNRELSQFPRDVGFGAGLISGGDAGADSAGSRGRGRGGGGTNPFSSRPESEDDAKRLRQLTAEVRNPSAHLTIVGSSTAVTFTDDRGQSRTVHPNGKQEVLRLDDDVPVSTTAKWEAGRLVVVYTVEEGRELRHTYSLTDGPRRLAVDVQFIERGARDTVRRVYEPASAADPVVAQFSPPTANPSTANPPPANPPAAQPGPDPELKGLTKLGIVVEASGPDAAACGLNQGAIEGIVSKSLAAAGLQVLRNSDEDTYVYVKVITVRPSAGLCVSRYDASLYTHTMAKLPFRDTPVLVQVVLLHRDGIAGAAPAVHPDGVLRSLQQYVDQFAARIRDANK